MTFTDNQLKGNLGEQHVAERLAACGCLIRHVPQGHDSGIDLYCETTQAGQPFLHFWAQVKVSQTYGSEAQSESYSASSDELSYWLSQPIPTFLALIPDKRDERPPIFLCSPLRRNGGTMASFVKLSTFNELEAFLRDALPFETFLWDLHHGKVGGLKTPQPSYTVSIPVGVTQEFEPELRGTLHRTLSRLSDDILSRAYEFPSLKPRSDDVAALKQARDAARPYAEALECLVEGKRLGNFENFMTIGLMAELDGNIEKAKGLYERALRSIDGDPNIDRSQDPWKTTRVKVEVHLLRASKAATASAQP